MVSREARALRRTGCLLLAVSLVRWGWPEPAPSPDDAPGREAPTALLDSSRAAESESRLRSRPLDADERIDPNTASEAELDRLPGVGPAIASRIVAARAEEPYRRAEDLLRVRGIGPATLDRIRPKISVGRR